MPLTFEVLSGVSQAVAPGIEPVDGLRKENPGSNRNYIEIALTGGTLDTADREMPVEWEVLYHRYIGGQSGDGPDRRALNAYALEFAQRINRVQHTIEAVAWTIGPTERGYLTLSLTIADRLDARWSG